MIKHSRSPFGRKVNAFPIYIIFDPVERAFDVVVLHPTFFKRRLPVRAEVADTADLTGFAPEKDEILSKPSRAEYLSLFQFMG
jgi:hypothetical protein